MSSFPKKFPTIDFTTQYGLPLEDSDSWIIVDLFAGGGGASTGLEMGLRRPVSICINHNPDAISMHAANHAHAEHYQTDVWGVDPLEACRGRTVGLMHASPDCRHHSQAAGGQSRKKEIRDLGWVVLKWAGKVRPVQITMENVKQMVLWSPLVAKRCAKTGRVIKLDGTVAEPGVRVLRNEQFLVPDKGKLTGNALHRRNQRRKYKRHGSPVNRTWDHFIASLRSLGYDVEWRVSRACDDGAPTIRERLFMVARRDGHPIVWPEPSHAAEPKKGQLPFRTAAECIDWSDLGSSIWARTRPLVKTTNVRIATGIERFVLNGRPFIVPVTHQGSVRLHSIDEPMRTVTGANRGELMLGSPLLTPFISEHANSTHQRNMPADSPLRTICAQVKGGHFSLVAPIIVQANGGKNTTPAHSAQSPFSTITSAGSQQQLATATLMQVASELGLVITEEHLASAMRVADFMLEHGNSSSHDLQPTIAEKLERITLTLDGTKYLIVDICLRMLKPRELYRAQGFPDSYCIDRGHDGKPFNVSTQTHLVGNSVSPLQMARLAQANDPWKARQQQLGVA
ncbi:putative C-5 cytosine-specific DNA methylase [Pseudomonas veronii]|uniref:DNA cytosine methyltransferase n=1 Tax=Pseudomonas veronii TaxID=76761 RepID=UPI00176EFECD|nr:DNA cytosine methyltransferase [Pseudomonas veronii]CAD0264279.1 putative C-5 cytosine-specific DNA methylase [Pseudomonas veronii]